MCLSFLCYSLMIILVPLSTLHAWLGFVNILGLLNSNSLGEGEENELDRTSLAQNEKKKDILERLSNYRENTTQQTNVIIITFYYYYFLNYTASYNLNY